MAQVASEVTEEEAQGKVKNAYEDIKASLRVPFVASVFRSLAIDPDYLEVAWSALKPNVQTAYFERKADELRAFAVDTAVALGSHDLPKVEEGLDRVLHVLQYAEPKYYLATAALRSATNGQQPKLQELPRDAMRQVAPGVPKDAGQVVLEPPAEIPAAARDTLAAIDATLGTESGDDLRALLQWPDYLAAVGSAVKLLAGREDRRLVLRQLRRAAEEAIVLLPYRMDISSHMLRHAGLSEQRIDRARGILDRSSRAYTAIVPVVGIMVISAHGREAAGQSPFPATIL